jgi:thioesterase-3
MRKTITEIKVRGYHADLYGHVNNARYLEFLEEARWQHYEGVVDMDEFRQNGWAFVVVNINISYRHSAVPGEIVEIEVEVKQVNSRSVVIHQLVRLKGSNKTVAEADVTFVILDVNKQAVLPIEGRLREVLVDTAGPHDVA